MGNVKDMTGQRFGRLTVIERAGTLGNRAAWLCKCDCGREHVVRGKLLRNGNTVSCGCYAKERAREASITHGMKKTRLYEVWHGMKSRCLNERDRRYKNYGARGITICDEWRNSFESFRDWALANGYRDDLTIDRKDNDGNYCPENCCWSTSKEQSNNRRSNKLITYQGKTQTMQQWADEMGISKDLLRSRLVVGKWSVEDALTKPIQKHSNKP